MAAAVSACPCGAGPTYADCCGRWHSGAPAPDAEALMRSRYSAFVREDAGYLLATWHPDFRPPSLTLTPGLRWLGLQVKAVVRLQEDAAEVRFIARSRIGGGPAIRHEERSRFRRVDGRWYYCDGDLVGARGR